MNLNFIIIYSVLYFIVYYSEGFSENNFNKTSDLEIYNNAVMSSELLDKSKVLSRRKRFLVFPEGSSVQLVFCVTYPMLVTVGDIFLYGYTAALAWELPQDPFSPFDHKADPLHRRVDTKNILFTDDKGRVLWKKHYNKKKIINPAFAKRSVPETNGENVLFEKRTSKFKVDRKQMHASQQKREFLKIEHMDGPSVEFHRSSRASLYEKIEGLLKAWGIDGRQCLLKTLCQVGQTKEQSQGSFLQEILRVVFTLPQGSEFADEYHKDYDAAHSTKESCDEIYPQCKEPAADAPTYFA